MDRQFISVENVENFVDNRICAKKFLTLIYGKLFYSFPDVYFDNITLYDKFISFVILKNA
jgi:hypothetical protein